MLTRFARVSAALVAVLTTGVSAASAQDTTEVTLDDGTSASASTQQAGFMEGGGVKVSEDLVLHPRFELHTGYQTNVFREDGGTGGEEAGSALMRFVVGGVMSNRTEGEAATARPMAVNASVDLTWNQFISSEDYVNDHSDLGIGAAVDLKFNPEGRVVFGLRDGFTRSVMPPPSQTPESIDRDKNELSASLTWKPGGGAISVYGKFTNTIELFENNELDFANRMTNTIAVGSKWQWLPKTSIGGEMSLGFVSVDEAAGLKSDSMPLRITVGISSLITPRLGTVLRVGYGNAFYSSGQSFSNVLFAGELRYAFGPTVRVAGGYSYDFTDSLIANFYTDHTIYGRLAAQFGGRVQLDGKLELKLRNYGGVPMMAQGTQFCGDAACPADRSDVIVVAGVNADYQVNRWLYIGAGYSLYSDSTDFFTRSPGSMDDPAEYVWHEVVVKGMARF